MLETFQYFTSICLYGQFFNKRHNQSQFLKKMVALFFKVNSEVTLISVIVTLKHGTFKEIKINENITRVT